MKINNTEILVTKIELREKKDSKDKYLIIDFVDLGSGNAFELIEKDLELLGKIKTMNKYAVDLNLSCTKFGLRLELENIVKDLGSII